MAYYIAIHPTSSVGTIWWIDATSAYRADTSGQKIDVPPGTDVWSVVNQTMGAFTFHELRLVPGQYYRRMARPNNYRWAESPGTNPEDYENRSLIETSIGQLVALREQLERIFRTVHPTTENFKAYGHDIRNVLILAATEVESHWKAIMKANGRDARDTNEYVKLLPAMRLDEFEINLPFYPWLAPIRPFGGWNSSAPTQSLTWYDSYNSVKHNREERFGEGNLQRAIEAVCGCAVIIFAQFGSKGSRALKETTSFFELNDVPKWHPSEVYPSAGDSNAVATPYPF